MIVVEAAFWATLAALAWTHLLYPGAARVVAHLRGRPVRIRDDFVPSVAVVVAAHNEAEVIERRIANLQELEYPREKLEIVVTSDASDDGTDDLAAAAGARVVRNARGGK